jgi:hypothetical protein
MQFESPKIKSSAFRKLYSTPKFKESIKKGHTNLRLKKLHNFAK